MLSHKLDTTMTQDEFDLARKALSEKPMDTPVGDPTQAIIAMLSQLGDVLSENEALIRAGHENGLSVSYPAFYGQLSFNVWWALCRCSWFLTEQTGDFVSLCPKHSLTRAVEEARNAAA